MSDEKMTIEMSDISGKAAGSPAASSELPGYEKLQKAEESIGSDTNSGNCLLPPDSSRDRDSPREHTPALGGREPNPRVYEVWPKFGAENRFFCFGNCVTGPKKHSEWNYCLWSSILVPVMFYFAVCARTLWENVSPLLPIFVLILLVLVVVLMLLTQCTDPGIIPKRDHQVAVEGLEQEVADIVGAEAPAAASFFFGGPLSYEQQQQGYLYCAYCDIIAPPRAYHCSKCNVCVLTFDHHCDLLNNCIGQRNYSFFMAFLISVVCLGGTVFTSMGICFSTAISGAAVRFSQGPLNYILLTAMGLPTALLFLFVVVLLLFHIVIACCGRTTKEVIKGGTGGQTISLTRGRSLLRARDRIRAPLDEKSSSMFAFP